MKFQKGDRVKIKETSIFHKQAYDEILKKYLKGTIIGPQFPSPNHNNDMWIRVKWDNDYCNNYKIEDLIKITDSVNDRVDEMLNIIEKYESR